MKLSLVDVSTQRRGPIDSSSAVSGSTVSRPALRFPRKSKLLHVTRGFLALCLSFVLVFTPFSPLMMSKTLAPISAAKADAKQDLKDCLDIMSKTVDAAKAVAEAVADPQYLACAGQVAALNPVTIAMVGAVTAFWATNTSSFSDPASCKEKVTETMLGFIADQLSSVLSDPSGLVYKILSGIIGKSGVAMINDLAGYFGFDFDKAIADEKDPVALAALLTKKEVFDSLVSTLTQALSPLMFQLNCGCYIAGTAAIIKHQAEEIGKSGDACLSLLLNPGAILGAFLDDPLGTLGVVGKAVCNATAEIVDICGAAGAVVGFFGDMMDAACEIPGVCSTLGAVADTIACWFTDCDEPKPPPPPPQCPPNEWVQASNGGIGNSCVCSAPMGKVTSTKQFKYTDYGTYQAGSYAEKEETIAGVTCKECGPGSGINDKGFCEKCEVGFSSKNADGSYTPGAKCTANYFCGSDEHYKADNSGCYSCPEGQKFNPTNNGCWPVCESHLVNDSKSGQCVCPPTAEGKPQQLVGQNLDTCSVLADCDPSYMSYVYLDVKSNGCVMRCPDPRQYYGTTNTSSTEVKKFECLACPEGHAAVDNVCKDFSGLMSGTFVKCGDNEIHGKDGICTKCEAGTEKGEGDTCVPSCPEGSEFNEDFKKAFNDAGGNWKTSADKLLAGQNAGGLASQGIGNQIKGASASSSSGSSLPPYCTRCGENEQSITLTMSGNGYSKTERVCAKCPEGQVSKPGGRCYNPIIFQTTSLTPQLSPEGAAVPKAPGNPKAKTYTPEEMGKPSTGGLTQKPKENSKNKGTAALPKTDPSDGLKGTTALPKQKPLERAKTTCPPGQVQQSGVCVFPRTAAPTPTPQAPQLNMPSMGGGSSAPSFQAPSAAAPSGTTALPKQGGGASGTAVLPRQQGGSPQGTAVQPRQQGGGFQGTPVLPQQNNSGNSKPF